MHLAIESKFSLIDRQERKVQAFIDQYELENYTDEDSAKEIATLPYIANSAANQLRSIRSDIDRFESRCEDEASRDDFYRAMIRTIAYADDIDALRTKHFEPRILRGNAKNFNHGNSAQNQTEGLRRVQALTMEGIAEGSTEKKARANAIKKVAMEYGVTPQAIYRWIDKQKNIIQESQ